MTYVSEARERYLSTQQANEDEEGGERKLYDLKSAREDTESYRIVPTGDNHYEVRGKRIEEIVRMTDMHNPEAVSRVYDVLQKQRIVARIARMAETAGYAHWEEYYEEESISRPAKGKQSPRTPEPEVDEEEMDEDMEWEAEDDNESTDEPIAGARKTGFPIICIAGREFPLEDYVFRKGFSLRGRG